MRTFQAFGRRFAYVPALGERTIELPMAVEALKAFDPAKTVEVGSVLPTNLNVVPGGKVTHRIIDRFDPNYDHTDACTVDYTSLDVLSVSTLEHFDVPDHENPDVGGTKGPECLEKIIREARRYFITLPLGYNKPMDEYVRKSGHRVWFFIQRDGPTNATPDTPPVWELVPEPTAGDWATPYGAPLHYANALVVLTNIPWIVEGTGYLATAIQDALAAADEGEYNLSPAALAIESQTGPKTRHFLNSLIKALPQVVYLEIGLRYGGSFISALMGNSFRAAYGIDKDKPENQQYVRDGLVKNVLSVLQPHANPERPIVLHLEGCWEFEPERIPLPVTVYFYDGPHAKDDHRKALTRYAGRLAKDSIFIVDDWNEANTKEGTAEGLAEAGLEVVFADERAGGDNMVDKYYNGIWVAHLRKP